MGHFCHSQSNLWEGQSLMSAHSLSDYFGEILKMDPPEEVIKNLMSHLVPRSNVPASRSRKINTSPNARSQF